MLISLSAAAVDKYEWYKYEGKKRKLANAHKKYDLELEPGDVVGLRKHGADFRLIDKSEPSVVFTVNPKQAATIVKSATGYKGKVAGVRVQAGIGGLDAVVNTNRKRRPLRATPTDAKPKQAERVHRHEQDVEKSFFPKIPIPPKKADIQRLYNLFNKEYFNNECPSHVSFTFSQALKYSGQARARRKGGVTKYFLDLATRALTDNVRICNIIAHEMIHLLHYKRYFEDGNRAYANAAHGPMFVEDMHRLNRIGFNVTLKEDKVEHVTLETPVYVLMAEMDDKRVAIMYSYSGFANRVDALMADLKRYVGGASIRVVGFTYGKTTSSYSHSGIRLTREHTVPKSHHLFVFDGDSTIVKMVTAQLEPIRQGKFETKAQGDVREKVKAVAEGSVRILAMSFDSFMVNVLHRLGIEVHGAKNQAQAIRDYLTPDEQAFLRKFWSEASDVDIMAGGEFISLRKLILKYSMDNDSAVSAMKQMYVQNFKDRMPIDRFISLCLTTLGDILLMTDKEFSDKMRAA